MNKCWYGTFSITTLVFLQIGYIYLQEHALFFHSSIRISIQALFKDILWDVSVL